MNTNEQHDLQFVLGNGKLHFEIENILVECTRCLLKLDWPP